MCGYYWSKLVLDVKYMGSPPRVRVLRFHDFNNDRRQGITPACAGTTKILDTHAGSARDHPRVCGYYV